MNRTFLVVLFCGCVPLCARADVGDPQIKTDHPWYPGELSCSTFERLFQTQSELYRRVTHRSTESDEDLALASWLWRNTHYWHGEEGVEDLWSQGFNKGLDLRSREYWTGLFAHGFGLCGTTHSQWVAELHAKLGPGRSRTVGTAGHNSFEVFLKGGKYGTGRWALLDHDLSTVVFDPNSTRMLGIGEITKDWKQLTRRDFQPARQQGWLICGLHPGDASSFSNYQVAEYLSGYSGPPPMVHLRRGESFRRYLLPGLEDGKTYVFWGRNYQTAGIPGPERSLTWVNQPEQMFESKTGTPFRPGQARYANAVFTYRPDFRSGDYREGIVSEDAESVTFAFSSPYIIGATPANNQEPWGIYQPGCRNGLIVRGQANCPLSVSVDRGTTWHKVGVLETERDLTDHVKGFRQYWLRFHAPATRLADSRISLTTVCQTNGSTVPRLRENGSKVEFASSHRAVVSAGPTRAQALTHVVDGGMDRPRVTLELGSPHGEAIKTVYAAAHVRSSSPPDPKVLYQIEYSADQGKTWRPLVKDWTIQRQGDEPKDFWSQSLCWGSLEWKDPNTTRVRVRFHNNGGKNYSRAELHLAYETPRSDATKVTFAWTDEKGPQTNEHIISDDTNATWTIPTGKKVTTRWVEMVPVREKK